MCLWPRVARTRLGQLFQAVQLCLAKTLLLVFIGALGAFCVTAKQLNYNFTTKHQQNAWDFSLLGSRY